VRNGPDWDCQCKLTGKSEDSPEVHIGVGIDIGGRHHDHHDWNDGDHRERDQDAHKKKEDSTKQRHHDRAEDEQRQEAPHN
jgi:hypothetical protein